MYQPTKIYVYGTQSKEYLESTTATKRIARRKKRKYSPGRLLLLGAALAYLLSFGYWSYKINQYDAQIEALERQKNAVLAEQKRLLEQKELVMSPEYVEKLARENLGLVKPGEKVVLFAEPGEVMPLKEEGKTELYD